MAELIKITHLSKRYGFKPALENVDLSLESGRIIALLGPNGSGKSTLIKLISGLLTPDIGSITVDGKAIGPRTKAIVSYLPERSYIPAWMKVKDIISYFRDFYTDFRPDVAEDMLKRLNIDPNQQMKTLSKGTREKVQLILVMSRASKLYLLDEPIAGVDPAARDYILDTILTNYAPEASIIISTHLIQDIERIIDDVIMIRNGKVLVHCDADELRVKRGMSIDQIFREEFKC